MAVKPNEVIGGYEFAQKLGEGPTASVWLAREKDSGLPVTIKLLKAEVFPPSSAQATYERLVGAVTHAGRLTHQSLAQVRTTFHQPRHHLYGIVSEYLDGRLLENLQLPGTDPATLAGVLTWFQQLAAVLAWLHTNGLVHGDVKPSNVMLLDGYERPHLKLLDLCWSLGLSEGERPTPADDQRAAAKLLQTVIVSASPGESPTKALSLAPISLLKVVQRAIQPDAKQQFPDMGAFFYAIESVKNDLEAQAGASAGQRHAQTEPVNVGRVQDPTQPTERVSPVKAPVARVSAAPASGKRNVAADRVLAEARSEPTFDLSGGNYVEIGPKRGSGASRPAVTPSPGSALKSPPSGRRSAPLIEGSDPLNTQEAEAIDEATGRGKKMAAIVAVSLLIAVGVAWGAVKLFGGEPVQLEGTRAVRVPAAEDPTKAALERAESEAKRAAVEETARRAALADEAVAKTGGAEGAEAANAGGDAEALAAQAKAKADADAQGAAQAKADADAQGAQAAQAAAQARADADAQAAQAAQAAAQAKAKADADAQAAAQAKAKADADALAKAKADAEAAAAARAKAPTAGDAECKSGNANACLSYAESLLAADQLTPATAAYERACDLGKLNGCMKAGELLEKSNGKRARRAYEKACDRRIAQACELLSRLYAKGIGGPANERAAASFKARACGLGLRSACK